MTLVLLYAYKENGFLRKGTKGVINMAITISDIAKEAGVSISTVSRVMNNTKAVSDELREKVYKVIEKNNYTPNIHAQSLTTKKTGIIGVIIPDISNSVFGAITKGINSICSTEGYTLMVCESGGEKEREINLLNTLEERQIDGVIFSGIDVDKEIIDVMKEKDYPIVLVQQETNLKDHPFDTVTCNNIQAIYDVVQFYYERGHRRIAYLGGPAYDYSSGKLRLAGYKKAMKELGLDIFESYIQQVEFSTDGGYEGMKKIYEESQQLPTAVVAGGDVIAIGSIRFLNNNGLEVPKDISVIGFDDLEFCTYIRPALSTVRIPYFEEGEKAAEFLFDRIRLGKESREEKESVLYYSVHKIIRRGTVKKM